MTTVFEDQTKFMVACDQSVDFFNQKQLDLYVNLIREEVQELEQAISYPLDKVETLDALVDIMVVTIGAINSMGVSGQSAWNEVMRSNLCKINPKTGKVIKRDDGKVLKGEDWTPPNLSSFVI